MENTLYTKVRMSPAAIEFLEDPFAYAQNGFNGEWQQLAKNLSTVLGWDTETSQAIAIALLPIE